MAASLFASPMGSGLAKKGAGAQSVSRDEAIDAALMHGWVDGQLAPLDESHWLIRFTPRRPKSRWSRNNCERAERLIADGRMLPAGLDEVARAKSDGRWEAAYPAQSKAEIPEDLAAALAANEAARAFFATLKGHNRFAILYRVHTAKKPETRAKRIAQFAGMLQRGETIHPQKKG